MSVSLLDLTQPLGRVLDRLPKHRRSGRGYVARCPAHDDHRESLSIGVGTDGRVLLNCHAKCDTRDIVRELGLDWGDLFPEPAPTARSAPAPARRITATYDYVDAQGTLLYQVVRFEPKDFRQRRPDGQGGWIWNLKGVDRVLYRLPAVLEVVREAVICIVEGEKDVHALEEAGFTATTHAGGAGKWQDSFSAVFADAHVVLIPDNDKPGREHMRAVGLSLLRAGAKSVRTVILPDLPPKGDVSDWLGDGHSADELRELARQAPKLQLEEYAPAPPAPPATDVEAEDDDRPRAVFRCTDLGNGERLVHHHGQDLRYVAHMKQWYRWDGRRWAADTTCEIEQLAKEVVRTIPAEAKRASSAEIRQAIEVWSRKSEQWPRITAMISVAKSDRRVAIEHSALDAQPWLLAIANGVLDLRTGEMRPHQREDLITHLVPITYDADAQAPRWLTFLQRIMADNQDLIGFLQRAVGYSLTGSTREQCFFFLHGTGANGKSTFIHILRKLVGDYAEQADFSSFIERRSDSGPRDDVAALVGKRIVTASEIGEGKRMDETLIKHLTGEDEVKARQLYAKGFQFTPQFKVWLAANHKPIIRGTDNGIWRRPRLVPFTVEIPPAEQDSNLRAALEAELPGILAWAVQGCLEWQEYGLQPPDEVSMATDDYRRESDVLGAFLDARCVLGEQYSSSATALYQAYKRWADDGGEFVLSQTAFGRRLTERGIQSVKMGKGGSAFRKGVALASGDDSRGSEGSSNPPANPPADDERFL